MRAAMAFLALSTWLLAAAPSAAQLLPSKCTALKYKAATVYAQKLGSCKAKARLAGAEDDEVCAEKAAAKFRKAFEKAERKGDCVTEADEVPIEVEIGQFIASLEARLERQRRCCETPSVCFYAADFGDCAEFGGTLGATGEVCGPDGVCEPPPVDPGPCCDSGAVGFDFSCAMGSSVTEKNCKNLAGSFEPNASCSQVDGCVPAP